MAVRLASNIDPSREQNAYVPLFYSALERNGIFFAGRIQPTRALLNGRMGDFDAYHFHWPEYILEPKRRGEGLLRRVGLCYPDSLIKFIREKKGREFVDVLTTLKSRNKRIIWTVHNLFRDGEGSTHARGGFRLLAKQSDLLICHDQHTADLCSRTLGVTGQIVVMEHGNYKGFLPQPADRRETRKRLGITENQCLLGIFGRLHGYKGIDVAGHALDYLDNSYTLMIGGAALKNGNEDRLLRNLESTKPNVIIRKRELSQQELVDYIHGCEIILLPYRRITGSGALLTALTLGRGVVTSDLPYFSRILAKQNDAGKTFKNGSAEDLAKSIVEYNKIESRRRREAALLLADQFDWETVVKPIVKAMSSWDSAPARKIKEPG